MNDYTIKEAKITISNALLNQIDRYLDGVEHLSEGQNITFTATFDDGMEMDVSCCGRDAKTAFAEAQLFLRGNEVERTRQFSTYQGSWWIPYEGIQYVANIEVVDRRLDDPCSKQNGDGNDAFFFKMMGLNDCHLTDEGIDYLRQIAENEMVDAPFAVYPKNNLTGFIIPVVAVDTEELSSTPECVVAVVNYAQSFDADYLAIEDCYETTGELPTYE